LPKRINGETTLDEGYIRASALKATYTTVNEITLAYLVRQPVFPGVPMFDIEGC